LDVDVKNKETSKWKKHVCPVSKYKKVVVHLPGYLKAVHKWSPTKSSSILSIFDIWNKSEKKLMETSLPEPIKGKCVNLEAVTLLYAEFITTCKESIGRNIQMKGMTVQALSLSPTNDTWCHHGRRSFWRADEV